MNNRKTCLIITGVLCSLSAAPVWAADLMDVYQQALQSDPIYQGAKATRLSQREALPQSVAGLLPDLNASANQTGNYERSQSRGTSAGQSAGISGGSGTKKFNSHGYSVNLTQPLFNFANTMQVFKASATAREADANFIAAQQDLIIRVAQAYFNVLLAQDSLSYTRAQKAYNKRQLDLIQQRYKVGLDAITSVYDAQASYDAVVAQEIAAQNTLINNQEALRKLTDETYDRIEGLKIELPLIMPQPAKPEDWVAAATKNNWQLQSANYAMEAARQNVKVNFGGHLPTVNAVGSYNRTVGASSGTSNGNAGTVGLQVSIPLFQGGLVTSEVRQAEDDYAKAAADRENSYRTTIVTTQQEYNNIIAGISKIKADRLAILSAQSSLDSTEESYKVGTRTIVDVFLAVQNLYQAKNNYSQDEYQYLLDTLLLKQAAGSLNVRDLALINDWLKENKTNVTANAAAAKTDQTSSKA